MEASQIDALNKDIAEKSPQKILQFFIEKFGDKVALSSSLGAEDQVLTDMLLKADKTATVFTLDTGRLFPETYQLIRDTNKKYNTLVKIFFPKHEAVQDMVNEKGINLFYDSIANRKQCCQTRKIEPLRRSFEGLDAWICGLRKEQSITRADMQVVEWDARHGLLKINPLIDWSEDDVWDYIKANDVPYNELHDKGFPSIGCQPCTRAVEKGEDVRAGRWWWESPETKECGLHKN